MAAGARALHRSRRRTRVGIAGAVVAVALVAVGVPTALNTLSAPGRGDVAGPSGLPTEGPGGAAERLRPWADAVRAASGDLLTESEVPDPERDRPCPEAADALGLATGMYTVEPVGINAGGTLTGCGRHTDETMSAPAEQRLNLDLWAAHDRTTDDVRRELADRVAEDGCAWTTLGGTTFDPLMLCEGPQDTLTLTVVDEDGDGAWVLTAAVGSSLPEGFHTGVNTLAELWRVVAGTPGLHEAPVISPLNRDFVQVVDTLFTRPEPVRLEAPDRWECSSGSAELPDALGFDLIPAPGDFGGSPGQPLCEWTSTGSGAAASRSIAFVPGADDRVHQQVLDEAMAQYAADPTAPDSSEGGCFDSEVSSTPRTTVQACTLAGRTDWKVVSADPGAAGLWVLEADVPFGSLADEPTVVLALADLGDRLW